MNRIRTVATVFTLAGIAPAVFFASHSSAQPQAPTQRAGRPQAQQIPRPCRELPGTGVYCKETLFAKPAVMGDSLTQGFYGATLNPETQAWAWPVLVTKQIGVGQLNYNQFTPKGGLNLPDFFWGEMDHKLPSQVLGSALDLSGHSYGLRFPGQPVNHFGITGADFSSARYTNQACESVKEKATLYTLTTKSYCPGDFLATFVPANSPDAGAVKAWLKKAPCVTGPSIATQNRAQLPRDGSAVPNSIKSPSDAIPTEKLVLAPPLDLPPGCGGRVQCHTIKFEIDVPKKEVPDPRAACHAPTTYHQLGLAELDGQAGKGPADLLTQMEAVEQYKPSFLFVMLGNNHVLGSAIDGNTKRFDRDRFFRDIEDFQRRVLAMRFDEKTPGSTGPIKGGMMFTVPRVTAIAYLEKVTLPVVDDDDRDIATHGLNPAVSRTYLRSVFHPDCVKSSCLLDPWEVTMLDSFKADVDRKIREVAANLRFSVFDFGGGFDLLMSRPNQADDLHRVDTATNTLIVPRTGRLPKARMYFPMTDASAQRCDYDEYDKVTRCTPLGKIPGIFGLDGIHPNQLGHTALANQIIKQMNDERHYDIPFMDEYVAWDNDKLNQRPIDLKAMVQLTRSSAVWLGAFNGAAMSALSAMSPDDETAAIRKRPE